MTTAPEASPEVRDAWRAGYAAAVKHARDGLEMARRRCHEPPPPPDPDGPDHYDGVSFLCERCATIDEIVELLDISVIPGLVGPGAIHDSLGLLREHAPDLGAPSVCTVRVERANADFLDPMDGYGRCGAPAATVSINRHDHAWVNGHCAEHRRNPDAEWRIFRAGQTARDAQQHQLAMSLIRNLVRDGNDLDGSDPDHPGERILAILERFLNALSLPPRRAGAQDEEWGAPSWE